MEDCISEKYGLTSSLLDFIFWILPLATSNMMNGLFLFICARSDWLEMSSLNQSLIPPTSRHANNSNYCLWVTPIQHQMTLHFLPMNPTWIGTLSKHHPSINNHHRMMINAFLFMIMIRIYSGGDQAQRLAVREAFHSWSLTPDCKQHGKETPPPPSSWPML